MRRGLISILLFLCLSVSGQVITRYHFSTTASGVTGAESRWFFEQSGNDEEGNHALTATGGATYDTGGAPQGTYFGDVNASGRYFEVQPLDYGDAFTLIFEVYVGASGGRVLYGALTGTDGFRLLLDKDGDDITFYTGNGVDALNNATALDCSIPTSTWAMVAVVVDRSGGTAVIYLDGVDVTTDGTIRNDFGNDTGAHIGSTLSIGSYLYGDVDAGQLYLWELTQANITTINTTPGTEVTN